MSLKQFDDNCVGCRPALIDPITGTKFDSSHPFMQIVDRVWAATTREQRESFHNVCCLNSREPKDLEHMSSIVKQIEALTKGIG
jgi:hypothetical protein